MLDAFLRRKEIDILLVKEVTYHALSVFQGYITQYNIGANRRGTTIIARHRLSLEKNTMGPSGRAMAAKFLEVWVINVYAPSGIMNCLILRAIRSTYYWSGISTINKRLRSLPAASTTAEY